MTEDSSSPNEPSLSTNAGPRLNYSASSAVLRALAADDLAEHADSSPDIIVDGYVVLRALGQGAGGQTFLAERIHTRAPIALKILKPQTSDERSIRRAWRELEILQQLRLPNVPRLLDFGPHEHSLYIATEYIEGSSLDRVFAQAPPESRVQMREPIQLLANIARAVQLLHEHGVIHRDLKPSNIMITADRTPFIIDFGIAALQTADHNLTLTAEGDPIGTPSYMPPEQARGERDSMSIRSDVYSLGAIGYWLLTGKTPHDLTGMTLHSAIHRVGWESPRNPREIKPDLPPKLAAILAKACNAEPSRRYTSAIDFAEDLTAWLDGKPVSASPPTVWQGATGWVSHHPVLATTLASLLIASGIIGTVALTVFEYAARPGYLWKSPQQDAVELRSRSSAVLHRWEASDAEPVILAHLETAPRELGGGKHVVLATGLENDVTPLTRLHVYRADRPDVPLWETAFEPPELQLPPGTEGWIRDKPPEAYRIRDAHVLDFFPSRPGREIAIVLNHISKSPACIQIYSLDGDLLYEAWHNGQIGSVGFLSQERLLVALGVVDDPLLAELGRGTQTLIHPIIVMALRLPDEPDQTDRPARLLDAWAQSPAEDVAWTRVLGPAEMDAFTDQRRIARVDGDRIQVDITRSYGLGQPNDVIHVVLDDSGTKISAWPDDRTRKAFPGLAESLEFQSPQDIEEELARRDPPVLLRRP